MRLRPEQIPSFPDVLFLTEIAHTLRDAANYFSAFSHSKWRRKGTNSNVVAPTTRRPLARSLSLSHTFDVMALGGKDGIGRIGPATAAATPAKGGAKISLDSDGIVPDGYSASTMGSRLPLKPKTSLHGSTSLQFTHRHIK